MWNNLRARHYSIIALTAIVVLQMCAIVYDKITRNPDKDIAFKAECTFAPALPITETSFAMAALPESQNTTEIANQPAAVTETQTATTAENIEKQTPVSSVVNSAIAAVPQTESTSESPVLTAKTAAPDFTAASSAKFVNFIEYSVVPGDSISDIASQFKVDKDELITLNNISNKHLIKAGETLKVPVTDSRMVYTVRSGDSLSKIASKFGIQLMDLIEVNNLKSHVLQTEQKLIIPISTAKERIASRSNQKNLELIKTSEAEKVADPELEMLRNSISMTDNNNSNKLAMISSSASEKVENSTISVAQKPAAAESVQEIKSENSIKYEVRKGDSLLRIAHKNDTTVAQIQADNNMKDTVVKVGQILTLNPGKKLYRVIANGKQPQKTAEPTKIVKHKVKKGETLSGLAKIYKTSISNIVSANNMTNTLLKAGQTIKIPSGKNYKIADITSRKSTVKWNTPTKGWISSKYGWRIHPVKKKRLFHAGLDIAAPKGAPIRSVAPGKVTFVGNLGGYGNLVILSHADGMTTRYGHCSQILVKKGQNIKAGQIIAKVGMTGVATGNHLHFEVRKNGNTLNPANYIRF